MERKIIATMVGYEQDGRILELANSLRQIKNAGLEPAVFLSKPPAGREQSRLNQKRARDYALNEGADLFFFEDDIDVNLPLFNYFFSELLNNYRDKVVFFYSHDSSTFLRDMFEADIVMRIINPKKRLEKGFYKFKSTRRLYFGQAVYIPNHVLPLMALTLREHANETRGELLPTDSLLSKTLTKFNLDAFVTLPHPIQHRHVRNGRELELEGRDEKFSRSFQRGVLTYGGNV